MHILGDKCKLCNMIKQLSLDLYKYHHHLLESFFFFRLNKSQRKYFFHFTLFWTFANSACIIDFLSVCFIKSKPIISTQPQHGSSITLTSHIIAKTSISFEQTLISRWFCRVKANGNRKHVPEKGQAFLLVLRVSFISVCQNWCSAIGSSGPWADPNPCQEELAV